MADGWAVEVETQIMGGGISKEIWYAHVPDRNAAEEAVKKRIAATPDQKVVAQNAVPHDTFAAVSLPEGGVGQW